MRAPGEMRTRVAALLRNGKLRSIGLQLVLAAGVVATISWLVHNTTVNLATRGIAIGFDFLWRSARFPISQSILPYSPQDSIAWAFVVGLGNTVLLSLLISGAATALGLLIVVARRSGQLLASWLATSFVEAMRNTPLVVQLLFWYALITVSLPHPRAAWQPLPGVFLTNRGLYAPSIGGPHALAVIALTGVLVAAAVVVLKHRIRSAAGRNLSIVAVAAGVAVVSGLIASHIAGVSIRYEQPHLGRFNFIGGINITPEFAAVLVGLVLYSAAYVGEIIRGGIEAIGVGQWEAGYALGLSDRQTLRLVILPQALRMIIPPLTSQYINIIKNTTLALVVGYPDLAFVTATTINQTGQAVESIMILMLVFLAISGSTSWVLNRRRR